MTICVEPRIKEMAYELKATGMDVNAILSHHIAYIHRVVFKAKAEGQHGTIRVMEGEQDNPVLHI